MPGADLGGNTVGTEHGHAHTPAAFDDQIHCKAELVTHQAVFDCSSNECPFDLGTRG